PHPLALALEEAEVAAAPAPPAVVVRPPHPTVLEDAIDVLLHDPVLLEGIDRRDVGLRRDIPHAPWFVSADGDVAHDLVLSHVLLVGLQLQLPRTPPHLRAREEAVVQ